jgi:hypothetical protein
MIQVQEIFFDGIVSNWVHRPSRNIETTRFFKCRMGFFFFLVRLACDWNLILCERRFNYLVWVLTSLLCPIVFLTWIHTRGTNVKANPPPLQAKEIGKKVEKNAPIL